MAFPQPRAILETGERVAGRLLKKAYEKRIDNFSTSCIAVRLVKSARMGEPFEERVSYPFNGYWR